VSAAGADWLAAAKRAHDPEAQRPLSGRTVGPPCAMPATDVTGGGREACGVEITAMWSVPSIQHVSGMAFGLGGFGDGVDFISQHLA